MNEFDQHLKLAKKKHLGLSIGLAVITLLVAMIVGFWLFAGKVYRVMVSPQPASATAIYDLQSGLGFFKDNHLYTISDHWQIQVAAKGYIAGAVSAAEQGQGADIYVELKPQPAQLTFTLTVPEADPAALSETAWYLNDELVQVGADLTLTVPPQQHEIVIKSPYYQVLADTFTAANGQQIQREFPLTPVQGQMALKSNPSGATVTINGQVVGQTPLAMAQIGGQYQLSLDYQGYQIINETVEITAQAEQLQRDYQLQPLQGELTLSVQPSDGDLLVDGKKIPLAVIDQTRGLAQASLWLDANRQHQVLYQKPGFYEYNQTLTLQPAEQRQLSIKLKQEQGKVLLKATPDAEVLVDGRSLGQTPQQITLPAVAYQVEFKRSGYRTIKRSFTPNGQSLTTVNVTMLTEFQARRQAGKATVAEQLGIDLVAFQPDQLTMGSPANEKGRRRNEFVKKVQFSRGILVSRHEITEAQMNAFLTATGIKGTTIGSTDQPVSDITWLQAALFCNWLSEQEGLPPFYQLSAGGYSGFNPTATGYRLPTEAEWEWLARRAKRAIETPFVWGVSDRLSQIDANVGDEKSQKGSSELYLKGYEDDFKDKAPVGKFKRDPAGLFDLAGNVSEWVHDFYTHTPPDENQVYIDPFGPSRGTGHVYKGGNYQTGRLTELRSAYREQGSDKLPTVGFRIVRYQ